jgi:hypothetical protein
VAQVRYFPAEQETRGPNDKRAQSQRASRLCCAPRRRRLRRRRRRFIPSAEERRAEAAAAESLAASGAGAVAKTAVGVAERLRRQWLRWLTEHGEAYEYDRWADRGARAALRK